MNRKQLIQKYIEFFKSKNHREIPNSSLVPENDPTVLFTTAGMHPLTMFLLGQKHPLGKRLCNIQKCIRTSDIESVGDETHHTFFEMLGNWSLGDYWKDEAIEMTFEFHTKILKIPLEKYAVTIFSGNKNVQIDEESKKNWLSLGIPKERIALVNNNWWGPAGETGPCGPDTEMFCWSAKTKPPKEYDPNDERWVEIGNNVFMQYEKNKDKRFISLKQKNIDFGGGVERTLAVLNNVKDNYMTDCFKLIIEEIEKISKKNYNGNEKAMRIIADHIKSSIFILSEGIIPSNKEQGYILRRLIRRAIRYGREIKLKNFSSKVAEPVFNIYSDYSELKENKKKILFELEKEEKRFLETLDKGIKILKNETDSIKSEWKVTILKDVRDKSNSKNKSDSNKRKFSGKTAFLLYQSYGFPIEMTREILWEEGFSLNEKEFKQELKKHQELSRTASAGRFKSGLADASVLTTRLHTATHLLNEALRIILGEQVKQKGSNITPERLRFDFLFDRKLTSEEIKKVEELINKKIKESVEVSREEMSLKEALNSGAQGEFGEKYPERVSVYTIKDDKDKRGWFSKEICTGPHVKNTKELGKFKIIKEESSSSGIRRIKAILEDYS